MPKKKSPQSAPKKNKISGSKIQINKISPGKLIDDKIVTIGNSRFPLTLAVVTVALLIAAVGFFAYAFFYRYAFVQPASNSDSINLSGIKYEKSAAQNVQDAHADKPENPELASEESDELSVEKKMLKILDTPTGYLNVRKGPGTGYEVIKKVSPGETFEMISKDSQTGWYEIDLGEEENGWVTSSYSEEI